MALSVHEGGVPVMDGSAVGEPVGGICVGTVKACLVGGRVDVTKRGAAGVAVSLACVDTSTQDANRETRMSVIVILLFIFIFYGLPKSTV